MADDISAKELLDKLDSYHKEIVALARETTSSVSTLESATSRVEASEKKVWNVYKPQIATAIVLFALLIFIIGIALTMSHTNLCVVNVGDSGKSATITSCRNVHP